MSRAAGASAESTTTSALPASGVGILCLSPFGLA
jgi:hypothetical protein